MGTCTTMSWGIRQAPMCILCSVTQSMSLLVTILDRFELTRLMASKCQGKSIVLVIVSDLSPLT